METINIKELLDYFKSKILIIIAAVVVLLVVGGIYTLFIQVPKYESSASIILIGNNSEESLNSSDVSLNKNLVSTYSKIAKSKRVLRDVMLTLNLEYTYEQLTNMIEVSSVDDTEVIEIKVTSSNAKMSSKIANEISKVFSEQILKLYNMTNVDILDKAEVPSSPCNINYMKQLVIFGAAGLIIGLGIVFVMFYFDVTIKSSEQIEKLGLTVLGTIQEKVRR